MASPSPSGTANGHQPRAARRRVQNNTPMPSGLGAAEDTLAKIIGESVALHLAQLLAPMFQGLAQASARQPLGCLYCAARRKIAQAQWTAALAASRTEWEIACKAAAELGDPAPEWVDPEPPPLPDIQEAFTWVPIMAAPGMPPVAVPVCYDDLPDRPGEPAEAEPAKPAFRDAGLLTGDGRRVVVQAG